MSAISEDLARIQSAVYGEEVRGSIHHAIEQCYTDVTTAETLANTAANNANTKAGLADAATTRANQAAATAENFTGLVAPTYSTSATYAVGDYVVYNGAMYRCITAIDTAEAWTAAHWTAVNTGAEVTDLKSAFENDLIGNDDCLSGLTYTDKDARGITWTWNGDRCTVYGSPTKETFYDIFNGSISYSFPKGMHAGGKYRITYTVYSAGENTKTPRLLVFFYYSDGTFIYKNVIDKAGQAVFEFPVDCVGTVIKYHVPNGSTDVYNLTLGIKISSVSIDAQLSTLDSKINAEQNFRIFGDDKINEKIGDIKFSGDPTEVSLGTAISGALTGTIGNSISVAATPNYEHYVVPVPAGKKYFGAIFTLAKTTTYPNYVFAVDSNGIVLDLFGANDGSGPVLKQYYFTIQENTAYIYIMNCKVALTSSCSLVYYDDMQDLQTQINDIVMKFEKDDLKESDITAVRSVINYNRERKFLNIAFITDTHWNTSDDVDIVSKYKTVMETGIFDLGLHGGDMLTTYDENQVSFAYNDYIKAMLQGINRFKKIPYMAFLHGNHDHNHNRNDASNNATSIQLHMLFQNHGLENAVFPSDRPFSNYFYIDYNNENVRLICADTFSYTGGESINSHQLSFIENALSTASEKHVLMIGHYISNANGYSGLVSAINNFISNSGVFIGFVHGHQHRDYNNTDLGFNDIAVIAGYKGFDMLTVDTVNRILRTTRIGSGADRTFEY